MRTLLLLLALVIPLATQAQFDAHHWRNIGPANMMGRISAVDGYEQDWRVFLVGAASGGVWKTTNGGTTFEPIFDFDADGQPYGSQSIGDVAFFQADTSVVWVGTGEATNRNSVGWGDGLYKSTDGGRTFAHAGLEDTYQIAGIAPHPTDPNTVYVAAVGHLFGYTGERGLFKTSDGGATWQKLTNGLPDDDRTGATVVKLHPDDPNVVFVGMYDRLRRPHHMQSGGPTGGLFRSDDGGRSFRKLTDGLPAGDTGQIDIDIHRADPDVMVAYVEADENLPAGVPGGGIYRSDDGGQSWTFLLKHFARPTYHGRIRIDPHDPDRIYVVSRDFQYSTDGGQTFERGQPYRLDGGDEHDLWISPQDGRVMVVATDQGARLTTDGGASGWLFNNMAIGQYYAIGADMRDPYWVYGGLQDNGGWAIPSNSRDGAGILTDHGTVVNGGDGFHMQPDPTDWRTVYTTVHVGYFGRIDMLTRQHVFITPTPETTVNFADHYDPEYAETPVDYTINPGEYWLWYDLPDRAVNGSLLPPQFRFNWNSPLVLSPTDPHTLYAGGNHLFRSTDRGETWRIISPDLTRNDPATRNPSDSGGLTKDVTGAENYHTIYTIDPSSLDADVIWIGTDDGNVQVTDDGGATWTNVTPHLPGVPDGTWVSRVEASHHDPATAYVTFDGHWTGDTAPYVYRTRDGGRTWTPLMGGLPQDGPGLSVHTIVEDRVNPNLLFLGTEFGVWASLDGGATWERFGEDLPAVAVHDLIIHPRDNDLIAGTHGRSIWIADDITPLQHWAETEAQDAHLFTGRPATQWLSIDKGRLQTHFKFRGENPRRGAPLHLFLRDAPPRDTVHVEVRDPASGRVMAWEARAHAGLNTLRWPMAFTPTDTEIADYRAALLAVADAAAEGLPAADTAVRFHIARDLVAPHRAPNLFDAEYAAASDDADALLAEHLGLIRERLATATSLRALGGLRAQLIAYATFLGDDAFFGAYPEPLSPVPAAPGRYPVTVTVDGVEYSGEVVVRADPLEAK